MLWKDWAGSSEMVRGKHGMLSRILSSCQKVHIETGPLITHLQNPFLEDFFKSTNSTPAVG